MLWAQHIFAHCGRVVRVKRDLCSWINFVCQDGSNEVSHARINPRISKRPRTDRQTHLRFLYIVWCSWLLKGVVCSNIRISCISASCGCSAPEIDFLSIAHVKVDFEKCILYPILQKQTGIWWGSIFRRILSKNAKTGYFPRIFFFIFVRVPPIRPMWK